MYKIKGWFPIREMGGCGFNIVLTAEWKDSVSKSDLNQEKINNLIDNLGPKMLESHGYDNISEPKYYLRVKWGEWGPEHITVPGNACGLDIDNSSIGCEEGEVCLSPHNVDSITQASMILTLFTRIAELLESEIWLRKHK